MERTKVLVIDQNVLSRRAIVSTLQRKDSFTVIWDSGGTQHLKHYITKIRPDIVLLKIESSDELLLLNMIRITFPALAVIVVSPRTEEGADAAIAALRNGAVDVITVPRHRNIILFAEQHLRKRLFSIVMTAKSSYKGQSISEEILNSLVHPQKSFEHFIREHHTLPSPEMVVIGGCTGGPKALFSLIKNLPSNLRVPVVVVQHFPKTFTRILAEKLDEDSEVNVREAYDGADASPGTVWIAPGGYHCEIDWAGKPGLNIHRGPHENNVRPCIDMLFRSAVRTYTNKVLGVLISGSGIDGIAGAEEIRRAGGQIMVQDPETAVAPDLPLSIIKNGLTRKYYSPGELANQIVDYTSQSRTKEKIGE